MGALRNGSRRANRRAFRPGLDGLLESRFLLSPGGVAARAAVPFVAPIQAFPFNGGHGVRVLVPSGQYFDIHLDGPGVVRAFPMPGGLTRIRVDGSTVSTVLSIDPVVKVGRHKKESAHKFSYPQISQNSVLNVGEIQITSGQILQILGYRTADLYGPLVVGGTAPVDRIAFADLLPGASIGTGGDLNTLDVFNDATLSGGPGIYVGRDLNWFNIGGNLTLSKGASLFAARDIGLQLQAAKGTDPGGVGGVIGGNLFITAPSAFAVGRSIDNPVLIHGNFVNNTQAQIINGGGRVIAFGQIL